MDRFLALLAFLAHAHVNVARVAIPGPDGISLNAALVRPVGPARAPAIVALHGCAGPWAMADGDWAVFLAQAGHEVLLLDSFGSRGLGPQCTVKDRVATSSGLRRLDAIAAGQWLAGRSGPDGSGTGVALLGWSDGGNTALWTARKRPDLLDGVFSRFVLFYPGCKTASGTADFTPTAPMLILVGEADNWTPAPPCVTFAARFPDQVTLISYPDAVHAFDAPDVPLTERNGLAQAASGNGRATIGTNVAARANSRKRVLEFLESDSPR